MNTTTQTNEPLLGRGSMVYSILTGYGAQYSVRYGTMVQGKVHSMVHGMAHSMVRGMVHSMVQDVFRVWGMVS